jgi:hypothetical protein
MNLDNDAIAASAERITIGGTSMARRKLTQAYRIPEAAREQPEPEPVVDEVAGSVELREERLIAHKETRESARFRSTPRSSRHPDDWR